MQAGGLLAARYYSDNANTKIKASLERLEIHYARSYSPHVFRLVASQGLQEQGSHRPTVAAAGGWRSLDPRCYGDTTTDVARDMSQLLIETGELSADVPTLGYGVH